MAVQTITYGDKSYLNQNVDIPATNKVQDTDMNEIKSVVNNNATILQGTTTYSLNETDTGKTWIDGKIIYRKSFSFTQWGGLGYDTEITDIENIINSSVSLKNTETSQWRNLSYDTDGINGYFIKKSGNTYKILIQNNGVYTADSVCGYIEYTKAS